MTRSTSEVLLVERDGPVTILTLNRPEALNAFDDALHHAFARFWEWLRHQRNEARRWGRSVRVYCYNKGAEGTHMRRIATRFDKEVVLSCAVAANFRVGHAQTLRTNARRFSQDLLQIDFPESEAAKVRKGRLLTQELLNRARLG